MSSVTALLPHQLCHLLFLGQRELCPQPRAQGRRRAAGVQLVQPKAQAQGPPAFQSLQTSLSSAGGKDCSPEPTQLAGSTSSARLWEPAEGQIMRRERSSAHVLSYHQLVASLSGRMSKARQHFSGRYSGRVKQGEGFGQPGPCRASLHGWGQNHRRGASRPASHPTVLRGLGGKSRDSEISFPVFSAYQTLYNLFHCFPIITLQSRYYCPIFQIKLREVARLPQCHSILQG